MKTLYIDCAMGCAGDMLTAALLELHPDREGFIRRMNTTMNISIPITTTPAFRRSGRLSTPLTSRKR